MHATARLEFALRIGKGLSETTRDPDSDRLARSALLSEIPGLAIAAITLLYLATSLAGLI